MAFGGKDINCYSFIDNLIDHAMLLVKPCCRLSSSDSGGYRIPR
jgi:hypothetical protein